LFCLGWGAEPGIGEVSSHPQLNGRLSRCLVFCPGDAGRQNLNTVRTVGDRPAKLLISLAEGETEKENRSACTGSTLERYVMVAACMQYVKIGTTKLNVPTISFQQMICFYVTAENKIEQFKIVVLSEVLRFRFRNGGWYACRFCMCHTFRQVILYFLLSRTFLASWAIICTA
jgi:hypothetical protein